MANITNIKLGSNDQNTIQFSSYIEDYDVKTIFSDWIISDGCVVDISDDGMTLTIKKFNPKKYCIKANIDTFTPLNKENWGNFADPWYLSLNGIANTLLKLDSNLNDAGGTDFPGCHEIVPSGDPNSKYYIKGFNLQPLDTKYDEELFRQYPWDMGVHGNDEYGGRPYKDWGYGSRNFGFINDGTKVRVISNKSMYYSRETLIPCIGIYGYFTNVDSDGFVDISDNPIIIKAVKENYRVDPSTEECWDAYLKDTKIYHKDKTKENCWKKFGLLFQEGYNYIGKNLTRSNTVHSEWIASNKLFVKNITTEGLIITKINNINWNPESVQTDYKAVNIKVYNKPDDVNITFERTFTNVTEDTNVSYNINNGYNIIPFFNKKLYLTDRSLNATFTEFKLSLNSLSNKEVNIVIELESVFTEDDYKSLDTFAWSMIENIIIPEVIDKHFNMTKMCWNCKPYNTSFWDSIKDWFANNLITHLLLQHGVFRNANIDELYIRLNAVFDDGTATQYMWANKPFSSSDLKKITIKSENGCSFSSGNSLFSGCNKLETIKFIPHQDKDFLIGATDFSGLFEQCHKLKTYPSNLIKYSANRTHAFSQGIPCTLTNYWFDYGYIETIPTYGVDRYSDDNTLVFHRSCAQTFNIGGSLLYIGPVLDLILVQPQLDINNVFNCPNVTDVRIKNLNHGDWIFDGVSRNGKLHGNLSSLDAESIQYLFANLVDLTTCNPEVHEEKIDKCFKSWSTIYDSSWDTEFWKSRVAVRYFETRDRNNISIVSTNQTFTDMGIEVSGLVDGDILTFGSTQITTNGTHYISKTNTNLESFKLSGNIKDVENVVKVIIENGLDYTNPVSSSANIYCPSTWEDKITNDMIVSANIKGWNIYIGGEKQI